jgi:hypothetical protein
VFRDDASAMLARVNALERELRAARREIAALRREAGYPVDDTGDLDDVEIRAHDLELARQMLAGLLDEPRHGAPASRAPVDQPEPPDRDAATEQLVVLRRALLALLGRKLGDVPGELVHRIDACPTAAQLIEWIAAVGVSRGRKAILKAFGR